MRLIDLKRQKAKETIKIVCLAFYDFNLSFTSKHPQVDVQEHISLTANDCCNFIVKH